MEYCVDSPKKKKRRMNSIKKTTNRNCQCIIHVRDEENGAATMFSETSWPVRSFVVISAFLPKF